MIEAIGCMVEAIAWIALTASGTWVLGGFTVFIVLGAGLGGLERLPVALTAGTCVAVAWVIFIAWLSPLTIGFSG